MNSPSPVLPITLTPCSLPPDVIDIADVEWASEDPANPSPSEYAFRPKYTKMEDPCGCSPNYDEATNTIDESTMLCTDTTCVLFACQEECRGNCEAGYLCGNKRITKKLWKNLQVVDAGPKGRGLIILEDVKEGDFLIEYTGVAIKKDYLDSMFRRYRTERMLYIMALDNDTYIDARKKGSIARYINHSCDPNCAVHRWKVRGVLRAGIFATKDIPAGTELSFDYKWKRKRGRAPTKCHCGSHNCRGTLEDMLERTKEEAQEEDQLEGHWKEPVNPKGSGTNIMNRTIKVWSQEDDRYFLADVCQYDSNNNKHCLIYRGEIEEAWEDLDSKRWMILDEEMEQFVIARKRKFRANNSASNGIHSLIAGGHENLALCEPITPVKVKNYVIVQTPLKEKILAKHLLERCQRHYRVQISVSQIYSNNNNAATDPEEAADEKKALEESSDGLAWKFYITGLEPANARDYLEKNIHDFEEIQKKKTSSLLEIESDGKVFHKEIVIPRCVADHVKNRLSLIRNANKNSDIQFIASKSMSKQFAKLIIESQDADSAEQSQHNLWKEVLTLCNSYDAPRTPKGLFRDLAFYGGELSRDEFNMLCPKLSKANINVDCCENLRESGGMASFEDFYRCTIWVQAMEDVGNYGSAPQGSKRKIFFGCEPKRVPELWSYIKTRITEIKNGIRFVDMEKNKDLLPFLTKNFEKRPRSMTSNFFDYIQKVTGAQVRLDNFNQHCIRIDGSGGNPKHQPIVLDGAVNENDKKCDMAEELIRLQIELLRDIRTRQSRLSFGRDWAPLIVDDLKEENETAKANGQVVPNIKLSIARTPEKRYIANACMEIADITDALGLDGSIAGHACVILYRYLTIESEQVMSTSQSKQRDILLACLFLASKAQKECKWKKLETVFEAAYKIFYAGARFDIKSDEATALEKRVLDTEKDILEKLEYDIFWGGVDWIITMSIETGHLASEVAKNAMDLALTGPILAAGAVLWIKMGPHYAFACMAAFLDLDLTYLFVALGLNPMKLIDAMDHIITSLILNKGTKQKGSKASQTVFSMTKEDLSRYQNDLKAKCIEQIAQSKIKVPELGGKQKEYARIAKYSNRRCIIRGVRTDTVINVLLPRFSEIKDRCNCLVFVEEGDVFGTEDIVLEGSWREVALASSILEESVSTINETLPESVENEIPYDEITRGRTTPGLLSMVSIDPSDRWEDVGEYGWKSKIGGKTCLPGTIRCSALEEAGMRWWLKPGYCQTLSGSLCHILQVRNSFGRGDMNAQLKEIGKIAKSLDEISGMIHFPSLEQGLSNNMDIESNASTAISLQRWPPEKTEVKERARGGMDVGFSPAALQEMQILSKLHSIIPGPQGHPNIMLPIAVSIEGKDVASMDIDVTKSKQKPASSDYMTGNTDELFSMLFTNDKPRQDLEKKRVFKGAHVVFQPTPMILQRVMNKCKRKNDEVSKPEFRLPVSIVFAWFHDLLSAMAHCHTNHIILRTIHSDQILIDSSGLAKLSGLARSVVLHPLERDRYLDPLSSSKSKKKVPTITDEDIASNPYMAPELLLGATRYTPETDIWTLAALIAHLVLGKSLFSGKDRKSKLHSIFKISGTPSSTNFKDAQSFPYYKVCKAEKKYKAGVGKAMRYMFKDDNEDSFEHFVPIINLLEKMLVLDPKERISAVEALKEDVMIEYIKWTETPQYRAKFVTDWNNLRNILNEDTSGNTKTIQEYANGKEFEKLQPKRSYQVATLGMPDEDGLYDMDELIGTNSKRVKQGN